VRRCAAAAAAASLSVTTRSVRAREGAGPAVKKTRVLRQRSACVDA